MSDEMRTEMSNRNVECSANGAATRSRVSYPWRSRRPSLVASSSSLIAHRSSLLSLVVLLSFATAAAASPNGERLYLSHCASCHGKNAAGNGPDAKLFATKPRDLRQGFLGSYTTSELARRVLDGRGLQLAFDLPALKARAKEVESLVVYMRRLPEVDWPQVEEGEWVYTRRCEDCHGRYGEPGEELPPGVRKPRDLSDPAFQRSTSEAELEIAVSHGRDGMPGLVPRLGEGEARLVALYVRHLSPGHETYSQYCANCHGADGRGVGSFGEAMPLPTIAFDRDYFRRSDGERVRAEAWHMLEEHQPSMPHLREALSEDEARSIIEHLRTLEKAGAGD
jgi:mono/diheme cytochrome c family protein